MAADGARAARQAARGWLEFQNPDGGWPYRPGGSSWTEPTALALMALRQAGVSGAPPDRALAWLRAAQLPDGGWPPHPAVRQSTWVTAVVAWLGPEALGAACLRRGLAWTLRQTGEDTNLFSRLRELLYGHPPMSPGWPWYPGTTAWVAPTAVSMIALRRADHWEELRGGQGASLRARLDMGAACLLAHACSDGGWNHGAARVFDIGAPSYPETTGLALAALAGRGEPAIGKACGRAREQLWQCRSSEEESWLRLGLTAQRQLPPETPLPWHRPRTVTQYALAELAAAGWNPVLCPD